MSNNEVTPEYCVTKSFGERIDWNCPKCGRHNNKTISRMNSYGFPMLKACWWCGKTATLNKPKGIA